MSFNSTSERRQSRVRLAIKRKANGRMRLSVFRSNKNIYAQIIDDSLGHTLVSASALEKEIQASDKKEGKKNVAASVGKAIAERAISAGIDKVVFDRGRYLYHGRVKALAEAAREAGLLF
ncbi:50S ribosomal protein L18 [Alphaproteobacteria bacterium]|nr:50S ribosomal protein L18 [Alphaproteobacteria bacterium]